MSPDLQPEVSTLDASTALSEDPIISGISRADTLPDIADEHAETLSKLQVSDGDFHTKATVNSELFSRSANENPGILMS
jgi:hypothetical protein